jgi:hypothetical protein
MKMHFVPGSLLIVCAASMLVFNAGADPVLPYQQPIADQLQNDIDSGTGDAATLNRGLSIYHLASRSLSADIGILRDLNSLLAATPNYLALLSNAANAYQSDFQGRSAELAEQLRPAPRSVTKTSAQKLLRKVDVALANAVAAADTTDQIKHLLTAATKIPQTSNTIQRALRAPIGLSSMGAHIGALRFASSRGFITGGTNFQSETGAAIGEFGPTNGVLTVSAIDNGNIVRGIHLHVEGIGTNAPATYPLGVEKNSAFYDATDLSNRREYHFQCNPALTNGLVTNAFLTVDFIGTNYLLGRFAFVGTNLDLVRNPAFCTTNVMDGTNFVSCSRADTNTTASIYDGEFQLNFSH